MNKNNLALIIIALLCTFSQPRSVFAGAKEQEVAREASQLKNISDSQWNEMVGSKNIETYEVQKSDTMWDISKRIFGDPFYWPKMWTFNNGIRNPHFISPGMKLGFIGGSSESVPKLTNTADTNGKVTTIAENSDRESVMTKPSGAHEYDKIPADWWTPPKATQVILKKYDEFGLDRELKLKIPSRFAFRVPAIANDSTIPYLGEIVSSRREGVYLGQNETVFIKSAGNDLQVGTVYSILGEPTFSKERKSDRSGYIYKTLGEIKIIGVKDDSFIGLITSSFDVIKRGDRLYPLLPLISDINPIPAPNALESLIIQMNDSTNNTSQYRFIHFDRGIEDGVQLGQVFRIYDYTDPITKAKITDADFLMNADAMIVHVTSQFSTALVIRARNTITTGDFGVSLTDVSDIEKIREDRSHSIGGDDKLSPEDKELDELDRLDRSSGEGMGNKEEEEIKELDSWDKNGDKTKPETEEKEPKPNKEDSKELWPENAEPVEKSDSGNSESSKAKLDTMESIQNKDTHANPETLPKSTSEDQTLDTLAPPTSESIDKLDSKPIEPKENAPEF